MSFIHSLQTLTVIVFLLVAVHCMNVSENNLLEPRSTELDTSAIDDSASDGFGNAENGCSTPWSILSNPEDHGYTAPGYSNNEHSTTVTASSGSFVPDQALLERWENYSSAAIRRLETEHMSNSLPVFPHVSSSVTNVYKQLFQSPSDWFVSSSVFKPFHSSITSHIQRDESALSSFHSSDTIALWKGVSKRLINISWDDKLEATRSHAIQKWKAIIQVKPECFELGRLVLRDILRLHEDTQIVRSITDAFANKATNTIMKRANYVSKFIGWCCNRGCNPFPVKESDVYTFLYECSWQSPSFGSALCEALNFSGGVLGLDGAHEAVSSRVKGFCVRQQLTKRKRAPAQVLKVRQVKHLENILQDKSYDVQDRTMAGHCMFVMFSRSRWMDSQHVESVSLDLNSEGSGFVDAVTYVTKTANTPLKKRTMLPLTAPVNGLVLCPWAQLWLDTRIEAGLPKPCKGQPLLPCVLSSGLFGSLPLPSSEASRWLRDLLKSRGESEEEVRKVSSHSLKATLLSWVAKAGVPREARSVLGYHVVKGSETVLHYSRDEQASPLRLLVDVIDQVRSGVFLPDNTRSGYFTSQGNTSSSFMLPTAKSLPKPVQDVLHMSSSSSDSSSSSRSEASVSSGSVDFSDDERLMKASGDSSQMSAKKRKGSASSSHTAYAIHIRWKTLHVLSNRTDDKLSCGRSTNPMYKIFSALPSFEYVKCQICFGR